MMRLAKSGDTLKNFSAPVHLGVGVPYLSLEFHTQTVAEREYKTFSFLKL